jgi:hypothetical protein
MKQRQFITQAKWEVMALDDYSLGRDMHLCKRAQCSCLNRLLSGYQGGTCGWMQYTFVLESS